MEKDINLIFHNLGLRSYIEVDLCAECPRQDFKGCCGYYSPIFYTTDLAYLSIHKPELIEQIFRFDHLTILDHSVTLNNVPDGESYRCKFHKNTGGCLLDQLARESICRHFVCSGIAWWEEPALSAWKDFFEQLTDYEIRLNQELADILQAKGLSLRDPNLRNEYMQILLEYYLLLTQPVPDFIKNMPDQDSYTIRRSLTFGQDWKL